MEASRIGFGRRYSNCTQPVFEASLLSNQQKLGVQRSRTNPSSGFTAHEVMTKTQLSANRHPHPKRRTEDELGHSVGVLSRGVHGLKVATLVGDW